MPRAVRLIIFKLTPADFARVKQDAKPLDISSYIRKRLGLKPYPQGRPPKKKR